MAIPSFPLFVFFAILAYFSDTILGDTQGDLKSWCSHTPHPKTCEYYLNRDNLGRPIKGRSDFLKLSLQSALARAKEARSRTYSMGRQCHTTKEKAAWVDCVNLYEYTVSRLNHTVHPSRKNTLEDSQSWLSAALTNLETCREGFVELGVSDNVIPLMSNNVSELISNSLALNGAPYNLFKTSDDGFPTWVSPLQRKLLQASSSPASKANVVVAQDGSGNYETISAAISAASKGSGRGRFIIHIKAGVYKENVEIGKGLRNIMFVGDGIGSTIVTGSRSVGGGSTSFSSATVGVVGDGFIAREMTFRNTAGPANQQAVALRSGSDFSVFYRCSFEGYQDTLYVHSERQFYKECNIYGTVDFIFGNAAVVLQSCNIYPRNPPHKTNTITAQGRIDPNQNTGIVIHDCTVTASSELKPVQGSVKTYLGRPWKAYSRTVFMKTYLDSLINPAGWLPWSGNFALKTLYYGEYMNTGPGYSTANRVGWPGHHVITSMAEASKFTAQNFIAGGSWLPATGVPFTSGL